MTDKGDKVMWDQIGKYALGGIACILVGAMGGPAIMAQTGTQLTSDAISPAVLEERLRGHQEAVIHRLDSMQTAQSEYIATVAQIAENTGEIRAAVREQAFTIAALQGQMSDLRQRLEALETILREDEP